MPMNKLLKHKEHIIWDWNGTILNDVDFALEVINSILEKYEVRKIDLKRHRQLFKFPIKDYYKDLGIDFNKVTFEELSKEFISSYMSDVSSCRPHSHIIHLINKYNRLGVTQSVLSASDQTSLDTMISDYNLGDIFKYVFGLSNIYAHSKVTRGLHLIELSNITKDKTIIIGDTLHDLEVGKALGIETILLSDGHQDHDILCDSHEFVFSLT